MPKFPRLEYHTALTQYGTDKPDLRFDMRIHTLDQEVQGSGFSVFDQADHVAGICVPGGVVSYSRKRLDALQDFVQQPHLGGQGIVHIKCLEAGTYKSSVDKFFSADKLQKITQILNAKPGDLVLLMAGQAASLYPALGALRLKVAQDEGLIEEKVVCPLLGDRLSMVRSRCAGELSCHASSFYSASPR